MTKKDDGVHLVLRVPMQEKEKLEKEAEKDGRTLSNYVRKLLASHPDRQKKKA